MSNSRQVFISYGRDDMGNKFVTELYKRIIEIDKYELIPFLDVNNLDDGKPWFEGLQRNIRNSFLMIVVCSKKANKSQNVRDEWVFAMGAGIRIIAVEIEKNDKALIPPPLLTYHTSNLNFINPSEDNWQNLTNKIVDIFEEIYIPSHVARAVEFAEHPIADYRKQAIESLRDNEHPQAIEALAQLCKESYLPDTRWLAALFLAQRHKDNRAIPELVKAAKAPRPITYTGVANQTFAIDALFGINSQEAFSAIADVYQSNELPSQVEILNGFRAISNPQAIPAMKRCLTFKESNPPEQKRFLLWTLAKFADIDTLEAIENFLLEENKNIPMPSGVEDLMRVIHQDLKLYETEHVLPIYGRLIERGFDPLLLRTNSPKLAQEAIKALQERGDQKVANFLESLLADVKRHNNSNLYDNINHSYRFVVAGLKDKPN